MCSLATSTASQYGASAHRGAHLGQRIVGIGRLDHGLVEGAGPVGGEHVETAAGVVVGAVELGIARAFGHDHVLDERHPLAPVVERGKLADHRQHRVGNDEVVMRTWGRCSTSRTTS